MHAEQAARSWHPALLLQRLLSCGGVDESAASSSSSSDCTAGTAQNSSLREIQGGQAARPDLASAAFVSWAAAAATTTTQTAAPAGGEAAHPSSLKSDDGLVVASTLMQRMCSGSTGACACVAPLLSSSSSFSSGALNATTTMGVWVGCPCSWASPGTSGRSEQCPGWLPRGRAEGQPQEEVWGLRVNRGPAAGQLWNAHVFAGLAVQAVRDAAHQRRTHIRLPPGDAVVILQVVASPRAAVLQMWQDGRLAVVKGSVVMVMLSLVFACVRRARCYAGVERTRYVAAPTRAVLMAQHSHEDEAMVPSDMGTERSGEPALVLAVPSDSDIAPQMTSAVVAEGVVVGLVDHRQEEEANSR
eukprot:COSAG01_NODE_1464_length_10228_cov_6.040774_8_plen_358_part_00